MATATSNATKDAPQIKDPTTWDDNAAKTLAGLKTQFAAYGLTLDAKEGCPYLLAVNNAGGVVTVYAVDSATKKYAVPFMAMVCSGGMDTPTGYFSTPVDYSWRLLMGPSYGQYATRIYDSYLFHSVPYYSQHTRLPLRVTRVPTPTDSAPSNSMMPRRPGSTLSTMPLAPFSKVTISP